MLDKIVGLVARFNLMQPSTTRFDLMQPSSSKRHHSRMGGFTNFLRMPSLPRSPPGRRHFINLLSVEAPPPPEFDRRQSDASSTGGGRGSVGLKGGREGVDYNTYRISIPEGVAPGEDFQVYVRKGLVRVRCPLDARPGMELQIRIPIDSSDGSSSPAQVRPPRSSLDRMMPSDGQSPSAAPPAAPGGGVDEPLRMFEVVVPSGVRPGQPFALLAGGVRVLVTCPRNAVSGQKVRFNLPTGLLDRPDGQRSKLAEIKLRYGDKDGWTRTVRASDMAFQWTRIDEGGGVDERTRFSTERSAYVLKLDYSRDDDGSHTRRGHIRLVTPERGVVGSRVVGADGIEVATYSDIASAQVRSYNEKVEWFRQTCDRLRSRDGDIKISVRRRYLLSDSIDAVMNLSPAHLRRTWRIEYCGESGIDVGGLKVRLACTSCIVTSQRADHLLFERAFLQRDWFEEVTKAAFDPDVGLWLPSATNAQWNDINPASGECRCRLVM